MSGLLTRVVTALVLAPIAIACLLLLETPWLLLVVGLIVAIALWEWSLLSGLKDPLNRIAYVLIVLGLALVLGQHLDPAVLWPLVYAGLVWWLLATLWLRHFRFLGHGGSSSLLAKLLAGSLVTLPAWAAIALIHGDGATGPQWLLVVFLLIWAADVAAFFAGRRFGRRKLAPTISPGKTWAGFYGALVGGLLVGLGAGLWFGLDALGLVKLAALALATVAVSVLGDLFESLIKRHAQAKDSGSLFPGHGGMLDRFDSVFAALPVFATGRVLLGL